jgi:hypothetical protein
MPGIGTIEQAQQAAAELAAKNHKVIYQLPPELQIAGKPIRIFNVSSQKYEVCQGGMGTWTIPACEPGQKFSKALEIPFIISEGIPTDMEHIEFRQMAGSAFAESVIGVGKHRHQTEDLRRWGVFIAKGDEPTAEEIEGARKHLRARYLELVTQADGYYGDGPGEYKNITRQHREALDWLTADGMDVEDRPWHKPLTSKMECPACKGKIPHGSVKCPIGSCCAIIDWDKAYAFGMVTSPHRPGAEPKGKKGAQAEA